MRMFSTKQHRQPRATADAGEQASRAVLWVPLVVGGLITALLATQRSRVRTWLNRLLATFPGSSRSLPNDPDSLALLRKAIVGNNKSAVAAVLGTPPATANGFSTGSYHRADTWYYPLDDIEKRVVVIHFENGIAKEAEFIQTPYLA